MIDGQTTPFQRRLILFVIIGLAALLRIYHLDAQSYFHDEAVQYDIASRPATHIATMAYEYEIIPPGSLLALHVWLFLGKSDFWARLLFALAGIANVGVLYLLARDVWDARTGLIAALLVAANPFHIWYSQDARPYAFLMLLCALHAWFFLRCIKGGRWRDWLGFFLCAFGAVYSHPFGAFSLGAELLYALATVRDRRFWAAYLLVGVTVAACFLPYVLVKMAGLSERVTGNPKPITWIVLPYSAFTWFFGFSVGPSLAELHREASVWPYLRHLQWMAPTLLALGLLAWGWRGGRSGDQGDRRKIIALAAWIAIPLLSVFALSKTTRGTFNVRYACESFIPFALLLAHGVNRLIASKPTGIAALILLLAGSGISLARVFTMDTYWKEDVRSAGQLLNGAAGDGDLILAPETYAFARYYRGPAEVMLIPGAFDARGNVRIEPKRGSRIWLVYYREWMMDPDEKAKRWLDGYGTLIQAHAYPNCRVYGYQVE